MIALVIVTWAYMTLLYVISRIKKDMSIVDIGWGIGFIILAYGSLLLRGTVYPRSLIVTLLVTLWGMRLSVYILVRHWGKKEDSRYTALRAKWGSRTPVLSYVYVFMLQGFLQYVIGTSFLIINTRTLSGFTVLDALGITLWLTGFLFESIGDIQLYLFLKNPHKQTTLMTTGLWRYTRHPNYFGEITLWWGIYILGLSVPYGWLGIISPLTIMYLLLKVSGIPLLEKQFETNPEFSAYKQKTSALIPWFPRS